jgi:hypothetical protein
MSVSLFSANLTIEEIQKCIDVSKRLKINHLWLMATIYFETSRTMSPSITNKIGSVGLIQFTRDKAGVEYKTIGGSKYNLTDIKKLSFLDQMDLVELYYFPFTGKMKSFLDVYLVTFFPSALGKSDSYVLETKKLSRSLIASQNPIFDKNKDKKITLSEIKTFFSGFYGKQNFDLISSKAFNYLWLFAIPFFF